MHDIALLQHFYATPLGKQVSDDINALLHDIHCPSTQDMVAALGYGIPYLDAIAGNSTHKLALMPASLGAALRQSHPQCLVQPHLLPLADASLHSLLLVHALEHEVDVKLVLRETWRVIQDDGHLLLVLPYRSGLWSSHAEQPFGQGTPYSFHQIRKLLHDTGFTINTQQRCLYYPPIQSAFGLHIARLLQPIMRLVLPILAGVIVIHAHKTLLQPTPVGKRQPIFTAKVIANHRQSS